ncbi:MAG: hypothetical protein V3W34_14970 [Phycisphaerae bacterium]
MCHMNAWLLSLILLSSVLTILHGEVWWVRLSCTVVTFCLFVVTWYTAHTFSDGVDELERKLKEKERQ